MHAYRRLVKALPGTIARPMKLSSPQIFCRSCTVIFFLDKALDINSSALSIFSFGRLTVCNTVLINNPKKTNSLVTQNVLSIDTGNLMSSQTSRNVCICELHSIFKSATKK